MPRLLSGHTVMGIGSTGVSVDNALVVPGAGTPAWRSPSAIIFNGSSFGDAVFTMPPDGVMPVRVFTPGADVVCAGSGTIAAGLRSASPYTRLMNAATGSDPVAIPGLIPQDVDPLQGTALLYQYAYGMNLEVFYPTNRSITPDAVIPTGPLYAARILGGNVCWTQGDAEGIRPHGLALWNGQQIPILAYPGNVYTPLLIQGPSKLCVLYALQEGEVYLHPVDDLTVGHQLPKGEHFGLDAEVQPDGSLLVAWATNQGESAGSLEMVRWSLKDLEPLTPPTPSFPTLTHTAYTGVFFPTR